MSRTDQIVLLGAYNEWMNTKLYDAARSLPHDELVADRSAFFGSILGTLNHLVVGDTIWLKRFAAHPTAHSALASLQTVPSPASLDQIVHADLSKLTERRKTLDKMIREWSQSIKESDLDHVLCYANSRGVVSSKCFFSLVVHFFNHQTHHRGQASTLLFQAGIDIGVTDLLALIRNETLPS